MQVLGIIAEYNPFHSGHSHHIKQTKHAIGCDSAVLCVMSGNWVQRGSAAITDKWQRSAAALRGGADLILELPTPWAISSAEGFSRGALSILHATGLVDHLSFGSEGGTLAELRSAAACLDSEPYRKALRKELDLGLSFPLARQRAAEAALGGAAEALRHPNNNLGIEYLRALRYLESGMSVLTVQREGSAHDSAIASGAHASASYLRNQLLAGMAPSELFPYLSEESALHLLPEEFSSLEYASRAVFARLRTLSAEDFLAFPGCGEGLHHRLARAALETETLEELYQAVKSKRYTHSRIRRLVLSAFLNIRREELPEFPPYLRVLGMNERGKALLARMKQSAQLPILTKPSHIHRLGQGARALFQLEARCTALYALCRKDFGRGCGKNEWTQNPVMI